MFFCFRMCVGVLTTKKKKNRENFLPSGATLRIFSRKYDFQIFFQQFSCTRITRQQVAERGRAGWYGVFVIGNFENMHYSACYSINPSGKSIFRNFFTVIYYLQKNKDNFLQSENFPKSFRGTILPHIAGLSSWGFVKIMLSVAEKQILVFFLEFFTCTFRNKKKFSTKSAITSLRL